MLEIILDKDFTTDFSLLTNEGKLIDKIFFNEKNKFIISKSLLTYIEETLTGDAFNRWVNLFQYLNDNNKSYSIMDTLDVDSIYNAISNTDNYPIILKNSTLSEQKDHVCYLKDNSINNVLLRTILESNQVTFSNYDFNGEKELKSFFVKMYNCSKSNNLVIVSRYNKFDNEVINPLKFRFSNTYYWTTLKVDNCFTNNVTYMKSKLSNSLKIFVGSNKILHGRKIILGNMVIRFDDDFDKIKTNSTTWECTCRIDEKVVLNLLKKQKKLTPLN